MTDEQNVAKKNENRDPNEYLRQESAVRDSELQWLGKGMCPQCREKLKEQSKTIFRCPSCRRIFYL